MAAWMAAAVTATALALLLQHAPSIFAGEVIQQAWPWVPEIGLNLSFKLDGLSFMFAGLILVIGLLVILYAANYLAPEDSVGKFYSLMMLFMDSSTPTAN